MTAQNDLFADDHEIMGQLFDKLDTIPAEELANAWEGVLADLVGVIKAETERQGKPFDQQTIEKVVLAIAHYLGGRAIYLPTGDRLKSALRDYAIFNDYNGRNIRELSARYDLAEPHIYAIIRKIRGLLKKRHQPELFG